MSDQYLESDQLLEEGEDEQPVQEDGIEAILHHLHDLIANAKSLPLSSSALVRRDEALMLVRDARDSLPEEVRQARWLLREREEFMAERTREAEALMNEVRAHAQHMVQRTEIVRQANAVAQRILDDANEEARTLRHQAEDFVDQRLAGLQLVLDRLTRTVHAGRAKLAAPLVVATRDEVAGPEEDGFFDQDEP